MLLAVCSNRALSVTSQRFLRCLVLDGSRLCGRLSSKIISLSSFQGFSYCDGEEIGDLSLRCNGNHLVVVSALFSDQKSLMRDSSPLRKYYPEAECF